MSIRRVYVHGAGRQGPDAWPRVDPASGVFTAFAPEASVGQQAQQLVRDIRDARPVVYAHSIGAVPVALAVDQVPVRGLVLVEPALYDIARGAEPIERHIAIVSEARAQADAGDLRSFWAILRPLMFGGPFDAATWDRERPVAERWARTNLPWGHGVRERMLRGIPMLVVTGGWNDEYERMAGLLAADGAQHVVLRGARHRPMDLPAFADTARAFEASLSTQTAAAETRSPTR
ncbi:hypothetical protein ACFWHT_06830 [Microbacterium sp. NPDC058342]|uniref:hypothetical protein n=1 Tax=Microbacterium sp. NPDC058342 TaxID=3346454 RepID=UPI00365D09AD